MVSPVQAISYTKEKLQEVFARQKRSFAHYAPLSYEKRREALNLLLESILRNQDLLIGSVAADFGQRSSYETRLLEIFPLVDEIRYTKRHLRNWMRTRSVGVNWQFRPSRTKIIYQPLGVVGIIGAWNYPILLTLSPLVGAVAAGNHVMMKPSEIAPATANAVCQIISEVFPPEYVTVVSGDVEVASAFSSLPFDHLLFTGSGRVGRQVMKAAAENLTPVTLELGGKSPALVHRSYPISVAADRICSAKFWNAGQTCVAPDYVLLPSTKLEEFVHCAKNAIAKRFSGVISSAEYTHMISQSAWHRMQCLVEDARRSGAQVIQPNAIETDASAENGVFPPTLMIGVKDSMRVMREEIFGPILPIVTYSSLYEALTYVNSRPRPLALYYFDRDRERIRKVLEQSVSGGVTVNDCIFHLPQHALPFGGVGASGMGAYHGFDGFTTFSRKKGVLLQNEWVGSLLGHFFKPPYSPRTDHMLEFLIGRSKQHRGRIMSLGEIRDRD